MKSLTILLPLLLAALLIDAASATTCSKELDCNASADRTIWTASEVCSSVFGGFPELQAKTQDLASKHLQASMTYLLYASHFGSWKTDRPGFSEYFSKMSDAAFDDAVTIIKHMSKRGAKLINFTVPMTPGTDYDVSEIAALTQVLDVEKHLANATLSLIHSAGHGNKDHQRLPDGELAHFLADEISEKHADRVHDLAAHVNNLGDAIAKTLLKNPPADDPSFLIYMYDTQFM